ncbi:MAG: nucleotidyltransferase family protein [Xenococcaceae cyanobacterium MO_188.B19]|nr:nucleotidyltransferase family protein [Xenococcaceae cyanobacterium MO_188.B19]
MKNLEEIKQILRQSKPFLEDNYRITEVGIFGSYARGKETESSDVDVIVDYQKPPTLIMLVELKEYLSSLVNMKVDIVTKKGLKPRIKEKVLSEVIYV